MKHSLGPLSIKNFTENLFKNPETDNNTTPATSISSTGSFFSFSRGSGAESSISCILTPFFSYLASTTGFSARCSAGSTFAVFNPTARVSVSPSRSVASLAPTVRVSDFPRFPAVSFSWGNHVQNALHSPSCNRNTRSSTAALDIPLWSMCDGMLCPIPSALDLYFLSHWTLHWFS